MDRAHATAATLFTCELVHCLFSLLQKFDSGTCPYRSPPSHHPCQACRAPLPSGKLCTRYDRERCPFHGPVVARDKFGVANGEPPETPAIDSKQKNDPPDEKPEEPYVVATTVYIWSCYVSSVC